MPKRDAYERTNQALTAPMPLRAGLPPGTQLHVRNPEPTDVPDRETVDAHFIATAMVEMTRQLKALAKMAADVTKPVDEYQPQELLAESETNIFLQPNWEYTEKIETVLITGPVNAAVTVQLGDRTWNLLIGVSGFINLQHLGLLLGRSDNRILTATVPGNYTFELMGHADVRWG
jgi:hypothetical protein